MFRGDDRSPPSRRAIAPSVTLLPAAPAGSSPTVREGVASPMVFQFFSASSFHNCGNSFVAWRSGFARRASQVHSAREETTMA